MTTTLQKWVDVPTALIASGAALWTYLYYSDRSTLKTQRTKLYESLQALSNKGAHDDSEVSKSKANALDYLINVYMQSGAPGFTRDDEKKVDGRRLICVDFGAIETLCKLLWNMEEDPVVMRRCCEALRILMKPTGLRTRNGLCRERMFRTGAIEQLVFIVLDEGWPLDVRASAASLLRRATYFTWFISYMERDEVPRDSRGNLDVTYNVSTEDLQAFIGLITSTSDELERLNVEDTDDDEETKQLLKKLLSGVMGTVAHVSETTTGSKRLLESGATKPLLLRLDDSDPVTVKHAAVAIGNMCLTNFEAMKDDLITPTAINNMLRHLKSKKRQTSTLNYIYTMVKYLSEEGDDEEENEQLKLDRDMLTSLLYEGKENVVTMLGLLQAQKASTREKAYKVVLYLTQEAYSNNYDKMREIVDESKRQEELRVQRIEQKRLADQRRQQQMMMGGMGGGMGGMDQQALMQMLAAQGGGGMF